MLQLDNAKEVLVNMANSNVYERIGSLIFYKLNKFGIPFADAQNIFAGSILEQFIREPSICDVKAEFTSRMKKIHNGVYSSNDKKPLQFFSQKIEKYSSYLVFFTGDVKYQGDETRFQERAKFIVDGNDMTCTLLNWDDKWLVKTEGDIATHWIPSTLWGKPQLGDALSACLKKYGYKFSSDKKDVLFLPTKHTDAFYQVKDILQELNGCKLSIAPVIVGNRQDAEEYRNIISAGFEAEMLQGKRDLFEACLCHYHKQKDWSSFQKLVRLRDIEGLRVHPIATTTRYGKEITEKLLIVDANASEIEWEEIANDWVYSVKAMKSIGLDRLNNCSEIFKAALTKLESADSRYLRDLKQQVQMDYLITAKILAKVGEEAFQTTIEII